MTQVGKKIEYLGEGEVEGLSWGVTNLFDLEEFS